jgi:hypothetical protein
MSSTVKFQCVDNGSPIFLIDSLSGIYNTNTKDSTNSSTGSILLHGGLSIKTTTNSSSVTNGGALTIAGGASIYKDVYIGGNLTVLGTQTQIVSQTIKIGDNLIVLNASPISGRDAGILFERYQIENDNSIGDIINDTPFLTGSVVISDLNTVTLSNSVSIDDYYNNFYIKINSQIRRIVSYTGSTKVAILNTPFTTLPNTGDQFTLYNNIYASQYFKEETNNFVFSYTAVDPGSSNITRGDYIGLDTGYISIFDTKDTISSNNSIGSLVTLGGASIAKNMYVGNNIYGSSINTTNGSFTNITTTNVITSNVTTSNLLTTNVIVNDWKVSTSAGNFLLNYNNTNNALQLSTSGNLSITNNLSTNNVNANANITVGNDVLINGNLTVNQTVNFNSNTNTFGNIYTDGQNVGINVMSPSYHLDVSGNAHISGNVYIDGSISSGAESSTTLSYLTITAVDDAINFSTGSIITFGGITSQSIKDAESISNGGTFLTKGGGSIAKRLFVGGGLLSLSNSNTVGSIYTTGGNVGINTTAPQYKLDIEGTMKSNSIESTIGNLNNVNSTNISTTNLLTTNLSTANLSTTNGTFSNTLITNNTVTNSLLTNISSSNLIVNGNSLDSIINFKNSLDWSLVSATTGSFSTRYNNNPIMTINTNGNTLFTNNLFFNSNQGSIASNNNPTIISGGSLNISGDTIVSGTNNIYFTQTGSGLAPPSLSTRSIGSKIVLRPEIGSNTVDYAIGVETDNLWFSSNGGVKWYKGNNVTMNLNSSGSLSITATTNASGIGTGGTLTVGGGCSINKDLYIGGNLYVNGQNTSSISGLTPIGSYSGTSVYQVLININTTMQNTLYKVIGNATTTTNNGNTYIVSFSNLTTTTFTANILRLDSLFSGWTDANLNISWTIFP